jgi:hypothetical protein
LNPFDAYTVKARIAPALLLLLPLVVTVYAWLPPDQDLAIFGVLTAFSIAALGALAWEIGQAGRLVQDGLFARWGGAPTTQLLRHSNGELAPADKSRYIDALQFHRRDLAFPTPQVELQNPAAADAVYDRAVAWLREQTRDPRRFPLVADESTTFGFHRNLYALRAVGIAACIVGVIGSGMLLVLSHEVVTRPIVALVVSGLCAILITRIASEGRVREAGFNYARVLLRALDGLPSKT